MIKQINKIKGLEYIKDYYYVSSFGKVFSIKSGRPKILKAGKDRDGYLHVGLQTNKGKQKFMKVHRLVAMAFILNQDNKEQVNHKNEIKTDNYVQNLEWITSKDNINYGTRNERASKSISKTMKGNPKICGSNHYLAKTREWYETNSVIRTNFKTTCKKQGWHFENFKEVFADWYVSPSGHKQRKYVYIQKNIEE